MDSACRSNFRLRIQEVQKSLEADTEYRVLILSLLRMPISPLRRRLTSTVYQNQYENPLVMSPICRLWRQAYSKVLPFQLDALPGLFSPRDSAQSASTASSS